jgi:hypothetical protein
VARGVAALLALALSVSAAAAEAQQRDVGPVRVALFGGARVTAPAAALVGLAGEIEIENVWVLAAAASYLSVSGGRYARYEVDGRWRPVREGWLRPYAGAGLAVARSSLASAGGPARTRLGALALAGADVPVLHTLAFVEAVGVETGSLTFELRGGLRLLVFGQ